MSEGRAQWSVPSRPLRGKGRAVSTSGRLVPVVHLPPPKTGQALAKRRRATRQTTAGIEPAVAWQSLRGELP